MAVCPRCSYALVLLPKRLRYKCAKCGRLYLQKFIDGREFRRRNQKQREFKQEEVEREFEELWKAYKNLHKPEKPKKQKQQLPKKRRLKLTTEEERKQRKKELDKKYYYKNREKVILQKKLWRQKNKEHRKEWKKQHRLKQTGKIRQQERIQYWRNKQKALALQASENNEYKASKPKISTSVPTYSLAQLLLLTKPLYINLRLSFL